MCLFQTDTYLCGCPIKVSAFPQQTANGKRQSQPTSTSGKLCETTLFPCGEKSCREILSKEVVTKKRNCTQCDELAFHDYLDSIQWSDEEEIDPEAKLGLSLNETKDADHPKQDTDEFLPVLDVSADIVKREATEKDQQDYEASESGIKVLRLL